MCQLQRDSHALSASSPIPCPFYSTKDYTDHLLDWIEQDHEDGKPFFAYLAYTAPHDPLHAPQEYIDKYKGSTTRAGTFYVRNDSRG